MKNSGLFLNMAKGVFVWFFEVLMVLWFAFCVLDKVAKVLKTLVFPIIWAFFGGGCLILVHLGLEGLGVFVFLV